MRDPVLPLTSGPLKRAHEVVVIGGGVHGLSTAYHLAKSGRDVVLLERSYLGSGASGRNLASTRANYSNEAWIGLFWEARKAWETISLELDINIMFTPRGYLQCVLTEERCELVRATAKRHQAMGLPVELLGPDRIRELLPGIDTTKIVAAALDVTAGTSRHDALVWGYANAARRYGARIHTGVTVTDVLVSRDQIVGVKTSEGDIAAPIVVNAAGSGSRAVGDMAGVEVPTQMLPLEMFVTESYERFLDPVLSFLEPQLYMMQTSRGEFVLGSEMSGAHGDQLTTTYAWMRHAARTYVEFVPALAGVSVVRSWGGLVDMTPDAAGLAGEVEERPGFYLDCGWGGYGYMVSVVTGRFTAELINTGRLNPLIEPFHYKRFELGRPIPEALAVVDHAGDTRAVPT